MVKVINTLILMAIAYVGGFTLDGLTTNTTEHMQNKVSTMNEKATFGAGCFWCVEAIFQQLDGVNSVMPGYAGGDTKNPTYDQVCSGNTGHAEVCQISFDPGRITYAELLEVFWKTHDPTTLNRQGPDMGTQYRSVIFYHNEGQRTIAEKSKKAAIEAALYPDPIVTEIEPIYNFYIAEDYHKDYYKNNKNQPYCTYMIKPKLEKFKKIFEDKLIDKD